MKASKFIVLLAGVVGIVAFFLPLIAVKDSGVKGALSAYRIVKGLDSAKDAVQGAPALDLETDRALTQDANKAMGAVKGIVIAVFFPALLLALFGGIGAMRGRFGRGLGIPSLIVGLIGLGIWALLHAAASDAASDGGSVAGIGLHLLLVTGLGGLLGGLLATIKPDRGGATA